MFGYICSGIAMWCWLIGWYLVMIPFIVLAVILLGIYASQYMRDDNFITEARQEREKALQNPSSTPTITEKSRGLFVPPPLN
jgi:hypothetical protein